MTKTKVQLAAAAALLLALAQGQASAEAGDRLTGTGRFDTNVGTTNVKATVTIDARGKGRAEKAKGSFSLQQTTTFQGGQVERVDAQGRVTCLVVQGITAIAGGVITSSNRPQDVGRGFTQTVVDRGRSMDLSETGQFTDQPPGEDCPSFAQPRFTTTDGDFTVIDGAKTTPGRGEAEGDDDDQDGDG